MELITGDVEAFHRGLADLDALFVAAGVEGALDLEAGLGGGRDQLNHGQAIRERPRAPVLRDVTEQPVLNLIRFVSRICGRRGARVVCRGRGRGRFR